MFKKSTSLTQSLVAKLSAKLSQNAYGSINVSALDSGVSMEAMDEGVASTLSTSFEGFASDITNVAQSTFGNSALKYTQAQKDAAAIIAGYSKAPMTYLRASFENGLPSVSNSDSHRYETFDAYDVAPGEYRTSPAFGLEAFDEQNLNKYMAYSIAFNLQAACQDEACEMLYPTVTVTPDQGGFSITTKLQNVLNQVKHELSGKPVTWSQRNVLDAFIDSSILESEILLLAPYFQEGSESSAAALVDKTIITPADTTIAGTTFKTQPLRTGKRVDLLGVSQHPGVAATGKLGYDDQIDGRVVLKNIYVRTNSLAAETGAKEVFKFDIYNTARSGFNKSQEGHSQELNLNYINDKLTLTGTTKTLSDADPVSTDKITVGNYNFFLRARMTGFVNVEQGDIQVDAQPIEVYKVTDATGNEQDLAAVAVAAAIADLGTLTVIGYDLEARRTNSNLRTKGLQVACYEFTERYHLRQGSPLMIPAPLIGNTGNASSDLSDLITLARVRNSNLGISALIKRAATLSVYQNVPASLNDPIPVQGIGRFHVKHYYGFETLDPTLMVSSLTSKDRILDIRAAFVAKLRNDAYVMMVKSQYKTALDQMTGFSGQRVTVGIVTDQTLGQYIFVEGESRTLGPDVDFKVVSSPDIRMRGKIYMTFVRPNVSEPSPLHFGIHAWTPEMTVEAQLQREGSMHKELIVQPKNLHINILPVIHEYTVNLVKLAEIIGTKTSIDFNNV